MKKSLKIFFILTIILSMVMACKPINAASTSYANISASTREIKVGDTVTVTVNVFSGSWGININGGGLEAVGDTTGLAGQTSTQGNSNASKTYTFKANSAGTYTISISGDITDYNTDENIPISKSVTVTVTEPTPPAETPDEPEQPEENNPTETPQEPEQPEENNPNEEPKPDNNENNNQENNNQDTTPQEPEETFTPVNKTMYVNATSVNFRKGPDYSYAVVRKLSNNEKVFVIGEGSKWNKIRTEKGEEGYVFKTYLTETEPEKDESSVATLSNLTVSPGKLNEAFSKNTLSYTMTVEADVDSITVTPTLSDDKAEVTVRGNTGLTAGTGNEIIIKVVAEDGISTKTYKISVTKLATEDEDPNIIEEPKLGLSTLSIDGLKINPEFKNTVYEYKATLTDKTINKLTVNAVPAFEDSKVEITGADEIKDGENVITITVTSANGEETVTYQIIVEKKEPTVAAKIEPKQTENSTSNIIIALIAAIAIVVLILIFILIKRKEKPQRVAGFEDGDYNEPEETYSSYLKTDDNEHTNDYEQEEYDEDDDDWGTPKKGFRNKFKKSGRHF